MNSFKINQYSTDGILVYEIVNVSLDDINKRFIKLYDFIKDAKFIGREFRRIQPVCRYSKYKSISNGFVRGIRRLMLVPNNCGIIEDSSYMESYDNSKNIVLYMKDNMLLVKYISRYGEFYKIIDCSYVCDGNYEFIGDVYLEYMDRDRVYSEIVEQINGYNMKDVKTRIRKR